MKNHGRLAALLIGALSLTQPVGTQAQSIFRKDNLVAWCIVPFDSLKRTPYQRIAMLKSLGLTKYAYDWRDEHLSTTLEEWQLARQSNIAVHAVWFWIDGASDKSGRLSESNERVLQLIKSAGLKTQFWVGFNSNFFEGQSETEKISKGAAMLRVLNGRAAELNCRVALYNHGGWFGEPENQVKLIKAAEGTHMGIVYNFHHAHEQLKRFEHIIHMILPYLWAVNLNGMKMGGPKILPVGQGDHEMSMMTVLKDSGYRGPIGILGHVETADVEQVLQQNMDGLKAMLRKMNDVEGLKTFE